jgi:hypothetical protein
MIFDYIPHLVITIVLLTIFYIIFTFWNHSDIFHKDGALTDKFKIILTIISTIASVVFGSAVVLQVLNYSSQIKIEEIDAYSKLSREFLDEILTLFINHYDMAYYYKDLFQIEKITSKTKRNITKEHMISMLIFSKCAKYAIFCLETTNINAKSKVEKWIGHVIKTLMSSDILRDYWTNEYKPKLSGPATKIYMKEQFNL